MMRQIAGSFAQHEKARVVAKLRAARERVRADKGKCGGRKSFQERDPQLERLARQLHQKGRGTKGLFVRSRASLPRWATSTVADSHTQRLALCSDKLVSVGNTIRAGCLKRAPLQVQRRTRRSANFVSPGVLSGAYFLVQERQKCAGQAIQHVGGVGLAGGWWPWGLWSTMRL